MKNQKADRAVADTPTNATAEDKVDELNHVATEFLEWRGDDMRIHRGALRLWKRCFIVFGNDSYKQDARAKCEAEIMRRYCIDKGWASSEIQTIGDQYSWAIAVEAISRLPYRQMEDKLRDLIWEVWLGLSHAKGSCIFCWDEHAVTA